MKWKPTIIARGQSKISGCANAEVLAMCDLIGRKSIKLYQAKVIRIDDVEGQREFAKSCEVKITLNQAWQLVIDKVKKALLRDIERHIELKALDNGDGTILTEASIWIEVPEGDDDG